MSRRYLQFAVGLFDKYLPKKKGKKVNDKIRKLVSIISIIGFLACTVLLLYPVISDRWNRYRDMQLITNYNEAVVNIDENQYEEEIQKAVAYNDYLRRQNRNIVTDAEYDPDAYYETLLNVTKNGIMGYVEIPKIGVTEPVYHYSTEVSLGMGVGHIHGSSLPIGGENTHTVLTGHRGLPNQKFFSDLDKIKKGDNFYMHILGQTLAYKVYDIKVIEPTDVDFLMIENGEDLATLVTCTPYGVNTHRLLVMGTRVPFESEIDINGLVKSEEHKIIIDPAVWVFAGFMLFISILVISTAIRKIMQKRKLKKGGSA